MASAVSLSLSALFMLLTLCFGQGVYNVALNKTYNQSSYHTGFTRDASHAANGNTGGDLSNNNCIHTDAKDKFPSWEVDLGRDYPILNITLYGRTGYSSRLSSVAVKVDQHECIQINDDPGISNLTLSCYTTLYGRKVNINKTYNSQKGEDNAINICEVQIWVCPLGYYGDKCDQKCENCKYNACSRYSGECKDGECKAGYTGEMCTDKCGSNTFGENCSSECGHCRDHVTCHHINGSCIHGCAPGWTSIKCDKECLEGFFGDRCSQQCGHCLNVSHCHHETGVCYTGCAPGYEGSTCEHDLGALSLLAFYHSLVAVVVVVLLIIIATAAIITIRRRRLKQLADSKVKVAPPEKSVRQHPRPDVPEIFDYHGTSASSSQETPSSSALYENAHHLAAQRKPLPEEGNFEKDRVQRNACDVNVIADDRRGMDSEEAEEEEAEEDGEAGEEMYAKVTKFHGADVSLKSLSKYVMERLRSTKLYEEFSNLPAGLTHDCNIGKMNENRYKNRFNSILPYDFNRVVLQKVDGDDASDYINASVIQGYKQSKGYIAAQAPKENTVDDFWRMVWQEQVIQIIMLTNLRENTKNKCYQYWPDVNKTRLYGNVRVKCLEEEQRAFYVIRNFDVTASNTTRHVEQYQFTSWMDHSVPSAIHLIDFWRDVKARAPSNSSSPPLVHCSAGVGRTGTYIALDLIIEHARHEIKINFFKTVKRLRDDRCSMVQNKDQYRFLHEAVLEAYSRDKAVLDLNSFDLAFPSHIVSTKSNKRIDKEFRTIQRMRVLLEPQTHHTASLEENRSKNRNPYALPADQHLVFLTSQDQDKDWYINAVYVPTMLNPRGCVLTQLPLPDTTENFWRLVDTCGVTSIVSLGETLPPFWPVQKGETIKIDPYTISLSHEERQGASLTCYSLIFQNKHEDREVRLLHYQDWKSKLPANTVDVLQLIVTLGDTMRGNGQSPLLIQCIDGAARSGLFCAVYEVVMRLTHYHVVDVYSAVRNVHNIRPQALTSVEEYRFCYEVAQQYGYSQRVYSNT